MTFKDTLLALVEKRQVLDYSAVLSRVEKQMLKDAGNGSRQSVFEVDELKNILPEFCWIRFKKLCETQFDIVPTISAGCSNTNKIYFNW